MFNTRQKERLATVAKIILIVLLTFTMGAVTVRGQEVAYSSNGANTITKKQGGSYELHIQGSTWKHALREFLNAGISAKDQSEVRVNGVKFSTIYEDDTYKVVEVHGTPAETVLDTSFTSVSRLRKWIYDKHKDRQ